MSSKPNVISEILFFNEDKDVIAEFDREIWRRTQIYMYTTALLVAVWGIFDVFIDFENLWIFLALRVIYTPITLACAYNFHRPIFRKYHKKWALIHYVLLIIDIGIMVLWTDSFVKYLIGFSTIFWGASVIMVWRFWYTIAPGIIVIIITFIRFHFFPHNVAEGEFITGLYYFATCLTFTGIISAYGYWSAYQLTENNMNLKFAQERLMQAEKMASLNSVVASIAHEINTPVGTAITAVSHAEDEFNQILSSLDQDEVAIDKLENPANDGLESVQSALSELNRTAGLVERLKSTAIDQSHQEKRKFNLREYIESNVVEVGLRPMLRNANISIDVSGDDVTIDSYPGEITQIFSNLILNSIHHAFAHYSAPGEGNKTKIEIIDSDDQTVTICYSDNGRGMTRNIVSRIFEPLFTTRGSRLSTEERGHKGSGLGMAIVYNSVTKILGGKIDVSSLPNRGVVFTINFPLVTKSN